MCRIVQSDSIGKRINGHPSSKLNPPQSAKRTLFIQRRVGKDRSGFRHQLVGNVVRSGSSQETEITASGELSRPLCVRGRSRFFGRYSGKDPNRYSGIPCIVLPPSRPHTRWNTAFKSSEKLRDQGRSFREGLPSPTTSRSESRLPQLPAVPAPGALIAPSPLLLSL